MSKSSRQHPKSAKLIPPKRKHNLATRNREYFSTNEIEDLLKAARKTGRHGQRNATIILMLFRHALRVSELISLKWEQIDFKQGLLHVVRVKKGLPSTHPLRAVELRALRQLQRNYFESTYVFTSERLAPLTPRSVHHIVQQAGLKAKINISAHPHMLRHSTGFYLANQGQDTRAIQSYMGHANIKNTVIYTELSAQRFKNFWKD